MTQTNDPPLVASVALIPDSDEKADLDAPSDESGKLVVSQAPNITITSTTVVADQAERLALDPQEGDIAIQQDTTESFIFTGGANELANWQLVQFDAVGGISGEDIAPRDIDGRNLSAIDVSTGTLSSSMTLTANDVTINGLLNGADTSGAAAGEALTSDGAGGFGFSPVGSAAITRNGNEIEYVALDTANLPTASDTGDVGLVTGTNEYVQDVAFGEAFDIGTQTEIKFINSQDDSPQDIAFSNDGTQLFELGKVDNRILQSSLSTPFDIATATFVKFTVNQDNSPGGITFNDDGTRLYEAGNGSDLIYQSNLSTAFDVATISFSKSINSQDTRPEGLAFNDDGTRLYEVGKDGQKIYQSSLTTPFDIATASFTKSINSQDSIPRGMAFNDDGTRLYEIGDGSNLIYQSSLSTPFDIGTATFTKSLSTQFPRPTGLTFSTDGSRLYEVGSSDTQISQSTISGIEWQTI